MHRRRVAALVLAAGAVLGCGRAADHLPAVTRTPGTAQYAAVGQVRLTSQSGFCTGVLVRSGDSPDAPAYALTSGHCTMLLGPPFANEVITAEPRADLTITFDMFQDQIANQQSVAVGRVAFATMKGIDVAVLELAATVADLRARGLEPLPIAAAPPAAGAVVDVLAIPHGDPDFLRRASCRRGERTTVLEAWYHFYDVYANDCGGNLRGGSSGSPVFDTAGEVFALVDTEVDTGTVGPDCSLNHPCALAGGATTLNIGISYAADATGLASCFGADGRFARDAAGCPLDPGLELAVSTTVPLDLPFGVAVSKRWGVTLSGDWPYFRFKTGRAPDVDCRSANAYGAPIALAAQSLGDLAIGAAPGPYLLCILSSSGGGAGAENTRFPSVIVGTGP